MKKRKNDNIVIRNVLLLFALSLWISAAFFAYYVLSRGGHLVPRAADMQTIGTLIKGKVVDGSGNAVSGAKVIVLDGDLRKIYISSESGEYSIVNLLEGEYEVRAEKDSYKSASDKVSVGGSPSIRNFTIYSTE